MLWRIATSIVFACVARAYDAKGMAQAPVAAGGANPKPGCYPVYQNQMPSTCATFASGTAMPQRTTAMPQRTDVSRLNGNLVALIKSIPGAEEKLQSFLEYRGIPQPWAEVFDFSSDKQHTMPAPDPMFQRIQTLIAGLETIKEFVSNELFKVEKYVHRAKTYLSEDLNTLARYHSHLKDYLRRMKDAKTAEIKNEYAAKFSELNGKVQEEIRSYKLLSTWLQKTVTLFRSLF